MPSGVPAWLTRNCGWSWRFRLRVASVVDRGTLIAYEEAGANKSARPRTICAQRFIVGSFLWSSSVRSLHCVPGRIRLVSGHRLCGVRRARAQVALVGDVVIDDEG